MVKATERRLNAKRGRTLDIVLIAMFVALITVGAFIRFPVGILPAAMQCAMCILCSLVLGAKKGVIAVTIYLVMGLIGIPIFTAGGGPGYVLKPTFGYLLGYIVAVPLGGLVARGVKNTSRPKLWRLLLGAVTLIAALYTFGVTYMYLLMNFYLGSPITLGKAWLTGAAVFLPTDCAWGVIASIVAYKVVPIVFKKSEGMYGLSPSVCCEEYVRDGKTLEEE